MPIGGGMSWLGQIQPNVDTVELFGYWDYSDTNSVTSSGTGLSRTYSQIESQYDGETLDNLVGTPTYIAPDVDTSNLGGWNRAYHHASTGGIRKLVSSSQRISQVGLTYIFAGSVYDFSYLTTGRATLMCNGTVGQTSDHGLRFRIVPSLNKFALTEIRGETVDIPIPSENMVTSNNMFGAGVTMDPSGNWNFYYNYPVNAYTTTDSGSYVVASGVNEYFHLGTSVNNYSFEEYNTICLGAAYWTKDVSAADLKDKVDTMTNYYYNM